MKVLILAAGYATRLYPLTENTPKALLPIRGTTILDHLVEKIEKNKNVNEIIIITNNKFYKDFVTYSCSRNTTIPISIINDYTENSTDRLGAIGDIYFALKQKNIDEDLMILASDSYFSFELTDFYNYYKEKQANCIAAKEFENIDYKRFGLAKIDNNNLITDFKEKPETPFSNIVTYAIYIYKKETLPLIEEYINEGNNKDGLGNFNTWAHKKMPIYCYKFDGICYDIGTIETYNSLNQ